MSLDISFESEGMTMKGYLFTWEWYRKLKYIFIAGFAGTVIMTVSVTCAYATELNTTNNSVKVGGDIALVGAWASSSSNASGSTYGLYDNYSLLGISGVYKASKGVRFIYNYTARIGSLNKIDYVRSAGNRTFLGYVGIGSDDFGQITIGRQEDLYFSMVDGDIYQSNWFFIPGTSPWHVDTAITYLSPMMQGTQIGAQAFNISKSGGGHSTTNYSIAIKHNFSNFMLSTGYMNFSQHGDGTTSNSPSTSIDNFGNPVNTFGGEILRGIYGINGAMHLGSFGLYAAVDVRKPESSTIQNTNNIYSYMATLTYQLNPLIEGLIGVSQIEQSTQGGQENLRGLVPTLGLYYTPKDNLFFSIEYQYYNKSANASCFDGVWCGTQANGQIALGATYSFSTGI